MPTWVWIVIASVAWLCGFLFAAACAAVAIDDEWTAWPPRDE